ncbi:MAG: hypothetical protein ACREQ9_14925 [Candidatus Binatia bacterium]
MTFSVRGVNVAFRVRAVGRPTDDAGCDGALGCGGFVEPRSAIAENYVCTAFGNLLVNAGCGCP